MLEIHLLISGSNDFMSSENKYGGLLTKAETELQRLSRVSPSLKKKIQNNRLSSVLNALIEE